MPKDAAPQHSSDPAAVGTRVRVIAASGGGEGFVAEDFGELPGGGVVDLGDGTIIHPRRYAVALDSGDLVFLDAHEFATDTDT